jgi:preprotein translocase subunit YajC
MVNFAAAAAAKSGSSSFVLILLVAYAAIWWFMIRPRQKRNKEARSQGRSVEVGDKVKTIGGLIATVTANVDGVVTLKTDSGMLLDFESRAIAGKWSPAPPAIEKPKRGKK